MLTPEEQAELAHIQSILSPAPAPPQPPGLGARFGEGVANIPSSIGQMFSNTATGVLNYGRTDSEQQQPYQVPRPYDLPAPTTAGERLTDLVPGLLATVGATAIPGGAISRLAQLGGVGRVGASLLGEFGGGAFLGASQGENPVGTGTEFAALGALNHAPIPPLLKALGNAAIPVTGQLLRGQNPLDQQSLINTGTNIILPGLLGGYRGTPEPLLPTAAPEQAAPQQAQAPAAPEVSPGALVPYFNPNQYFSMPGYVHPNVEPDAPGYQRPRLLLNPAQDATTPQDGLLTPSAPQPQSLLPMAAATPDVVDMTPDANGVFQQDDQPPVSAPAPAPQEPFGTAIQRIIDAQPPENGFGPRKVFLQPVYEDALDQGLVTDKTDFQNKMRTAAFDVNSQARPGLARADLPPEAYGENSDIVQPSELQYGSERFHFAERSQPDPSLGDGIGGTGDDHHAAVEQAVRDVASKYPGVDVSTIRSTAELPPDLRSRTDPTAAYEGLNDQRTGKQYVMSDNISDPARAREVAVHEIVGHHGVDKVLPPEEWKGIEDHVVQRGGALAQRIANNYFGKNLEDVAGDAMARRRVTREYVAQLAENTSLDPNLWQRIVAGVRSALRNVGIRRDWSDEEIRDLIRSSHENLKAGEPTTFTPPARGGDVDTKVDPSFRSPRVEQAAQDQDHGRKTAVGAAARFLEKNFNAARTPELQTAQEKGIGLMSALAGHVNEANAAYARDVRAAAAEGRPLLSPAHIQAAERFQASRQQPADEAILRSAQLPRSAENSLLVNAAAKREGQQTVIAAETPEHAATIAGTEDYQRRAYQLFTDPKTYGRLLSSGRLDGRITEATRYFRTLPEWAGFDNDVIEKSIRQYLADKVDGKGFQPGSSSARISQSLYVAKHDLTPDQWRTVEDLGHDARLDTQEQSAVRAMVRGQHLNAADQRLIGTISRRDGFTPAEQNALHEISEQETVAPEVRALFGEHTDPIEQGAYTAQKLIQSARQARTISEIAGSRFPDGRALSYTPEDFQTALRANTGDTRRLLMGYRQLPRSDGYGMLAGRFADRGVADALDSMNQGMDAGGNRMLAKIQKVMKLNATVLNPATHAHWWMQMPLMMALGRVYNPARWLEAGRIVLGSAARHNATRDELVRNGIIDGGAASDVGLVNRGVANINQPQTILGRINAGKDRALNFLSQIYGHPDEIIRTATYLQAREQALAAGLAGQAAIDRAIQFTNRYTFNYKALPKGVSALSNTPGINPFLGYSAELTRITKNLAQDVLSGNAGDRTHAALNLALMAGVPLAVSMGSSWANLSPDDQKAWARNRALEGDDLKAQIKYVINRRKDGTFNYIDISPVLPAGDTFTMVKDILHGDWKAFAGDQPLIGLNHSPIGSDAIDLSTGQVQATGQKLITAGDYVKRAVQPLVPPLTPLLGSQATRIGRSFTPNDQGGLGIQNARTGREDTPLTALLGTAGVRIQSEKQPLLIRAIQADAQDKQEQYHRELLQTTQTNSSPEARQAALLTYQHKVQQIHQELLKKIGP
jgi:hypothetical protein